MHRRHSSHIHTHTRAGTDANWEKLVLASDPTLALVWGEAENLLSTLNYYSYSVTTAAVSEAGGFAFGGPRGRHLSYRDDVCLGVEIMFGVSVPGNGVILHRNYQFCTNPPNGREFVRNDDGSLSPANAPNLVLGWGTINNTGGTPEQHHRTGLTLVAKGSADRVVMTNTTTPVHGTPCEPCIAGKYKGQGQGSVQCHECQAGKYSDAPGASACNDCPVNSFQRNPGATSCHACHADSTHSANRMACRCNLGYGGSINWNSNPPTWSCMPCPANSSSSPADDYMDCLCDAGYWGSGYGFNVQPCHACPTGTSSPGGMPATQQTVCVAAAKTRHLAPSPEDVRVSAPLRSQPRTGVPGRLAPRGLLRDRGMHRQPRLGKIEAPAVEPIFEPAPTRHTPAVRSGRRLLSDASGPSMAEEAPPGALGLKWVGLVNASLTDLIQRRNITNAALATALTNKTEFTEDEWVAFGIDDLRSDDFIQSGASVFSPDVTEHEHWICRRGSSLGSSTDHNNTAGYGNCVATLYDHLKVIQYPGLEGAETDVGVDDDADDFGNNFGNDRGLAPEMPIPAGQLIALAVLKRDVYGQDMTTDDASQLQVKADVGSAQPSVAFPRGSIFSSFVRGRADFSFSLKPTFAVGSSSLLSLNQAQPAPRIYFEGTDSARASPSIVMQTFPSLAIHIAQGDHMVCPKDWVLELDSSGVGTSGSPGQCVQCAAGKYWLNPLSPCQDCPRGAKCGRAQQVEFNCDDCVIGKNFQPVPLIRGTGGTPVVPGSMWIEETVTSAATTSPFSMTSQVQRLRITSCPRGFALNRDLDNPQADNCEPCPANTYMLQDATFDLTVTSPPSLTEICQPCPEGAECSTYGCASCIDGSNFEPVPLLRGGTPVVPGSLWTKETANQLQRLRITSCPRGFALNRDLDNPQADNCEPCPANTYMLQDATFDLTVASPPSLTEICQPCPVGATCVNVVYDCAACVEGANFLPVVPGSVWTKEIVPGQSSNLVQVQRLRITSCPRGFALIRAPDNPQADNCEPCPANTYALQDTTFDPSITDALQQRSVCLEAPEPKSAVTCAGDGTCEAQEGWYLVAERANNSRRQTADLTIYRTYRCEPGVCNANNTCNGGRTGVVCAFCPEDSVLELGVCQSCDAYTTQTLRSSRIAFVLVVSFIFLLVWVLLAWSPVFGTTPAGLLNVFCARPIDFFKSKISALKKSKVMKVSKRTNQAQEYAKILIGYFVRDFDFQKSVSFLSCIKQMRSVSLMLFCFCSKSLLHTWLSKSLGLRSCWTISVG